jgi:hypothetical protein
MKHIALAALLKRLAIVLLFNLGSVPKVLGAGNGDAPISRQWYQPARPECRNAK